MNDNDMIRRGDAILAVTAADKECLGANGAREFIRVIPAAPLDALTLERAAQVAFEEWASSKDAAAKLFEMDYVGARDDASKREGEAEAALRIHHSIRALAPEPAEVTAARVLLGAQKDAQKAAMANSSKDMTFLEEMLLNLPPYALLAIVEGK